MPPPFNNTNMSPVSPGVLNPIAVMNANLQIIEDIQNAVWPCTLNSALTTTHQAAQAMFVTILGGNPAPGSRFVVDRTDTAISPRFNCLGQALSTGALGGVVRVRVMGIAAYTHTFIPGTPAMLRTGAGNQGQIINAGDATASTRMVGIFAPNNTLLLRPTWYTS